MTFIKKAAKIAVAGVAAAAALTIAPAAHASSHPLTHLTRYVGPNGLHYTTVWGQKAPQGFRYEGTAGEIRTAPTPGTTGLYACQQTKSSDLFTSIQSDCEGQRVIGRLGWIYTTRPSNVKTIPLTRCKLTPGGNHFDSIQTDCEGRTIEGPLGWVVAA